MTRHLREDIVMSIVAWSLTAAVVFVITAILANCADPQRYRSGRDWCTEAGKLNDC